MITRLLIMVLLIMVATVSPGLPPCASDDGSGPGIACHWDASKRGNGQGVSYWIDVNGIVHY